MNKNLKADYDKIIALYLCDEKFIYRLNSIVYGLLGSPPLYSFDYSKISEEEKYIYQKIKEFYTTHEKRDLLVRIGHLLGGINERQS